MRRGDLAYSLAVQELRDGSREAFKSSADTILKRLQERVPILGEALREELDEWAAGFAK